MKFYIFFNTDFCLGGWANPPSCQTIKAMPITQGMINYAKQNNAPLVIELQNINEMPIFHQSILGRDEVEVVPTDAKKFDAQFGNLKLKFNKDQNKKLFDKAIKEHKNTYKKQFKKLNNDEKIIRELYKVI